MSRGLPVAKPDPRGAPAERGEGPRRSAGERAPREDGPLSARAHAGQVRPSPCGHADTRAQSGHGRDMRGHRARRRAPFDARSSPSEPPRQMAKRTTNSMQRVLAVRKRPWCFGRAYALSASGRVGAPFAVAWSVRASLSPHVRIYRTSALCTRKHCPPGRDITTHSAKHVRAYLVS